MSLRQGMNGPHFEDRSTTVVMLCLVHPWARELAVVYRLGGVDSKTAQSRSGQINFLWQRCLEGGGPCLPSEGHRCQSTCLVPHCQRCRDVLQADMNLRPAPRPTAAAPVPPARRLVQCQNGGLVWSRCQHQVPSPRSVRFGVTHTGGRMAGATLHRVRTSLQTQVQTHRQDLLQVKPSSPPKLRRRPVYV